jgi:predicted RND superfamily exporter protein
MSDLTPTSIALIVLGVIVVVLFILIMVFFYVKRRTRVRNTYPDISDPNPTVKEYFIVKTKRQQMEEEKSRQEKLLIRIREKMRRDPVFVDVVERYNENFKNNHDNN